MNEKGTGLAKFVEHFHLEVVNRGDTYDTDLIEVSNINRPDLQFLGLYDYFDPRRIQVIGKAELTYMRNLSPVRRRKSFDDFFSYPIPALVIARGLECLPECLECAKIHGRTILRTSETTADFTSIAMDYLKKELAPCITRHGVLLDIYGEGVMIVGDSGVGKSESAIELIMRGHRLVADDAVEIRRIGETLICTAPEVIRNYIELRGIGVIDVRELFGMRAVMPESRLDLVVEFEAWDSTKMYDRLGIEDRFIEILGIEVPCVTIPIRPGRNLASIVEVAAMNNRHRRYGYNAAQELARRVDQRADEGSAAVTAREKAEKAEKEEKAAKE
ncbi:MAG: HPr(Ser) kinase/phosphatase [Oscillibacter sp.]|nr:HPr(Ser) kinase/phosphatase [Oscillibacter sp.]